MDVFEGISGVSWMGKGARLERGYHGRWWAVCARPPGTVKGMGLCIFGCTDPFSCLLY